MCGINGVITTKPIDGKSFVQRMNKFIAHRGPDSTGVYSDEGVTLGHTRLSIIDLTADGNQPFISNDGNYAIVFNGEIYNYSELKGLLNYSFRTQTDTEVLLACYIQYGAKCLEKLNGMFSFCIYDKQKERIIIARDRLGIKPLYYYFGEETLIFSSELTPIINSELIDVKLNQPSVRNYLKYQKVYCPNTLIENVQSLEPGHYLSYSVRDRTMEKVSFWQLGGLNRIDDKSSAMKLTRDLLTKSVCRRLISDVPLGAFLSGGIDSSIIVGLMSQNTNRRVNTFNVTFGDTDLSESEYAKIISKRFNTNHHELILTPGYFLDNITSALDALDNPSGDGINTWMVSKLTKEAGITVALSGLGGDELFGGYSVFKNYEYYHKYLAKLNAGIRSIFVNMVNENSSVRMQKISQLLNVPSVSHSEFDLIYRQLFLDVQIDKIFNSNIQGSNHFYIKDSSEVSQSRAHTISSLSLSEMSLYMSNTLLNDTDQMSMAHQLEVRVPFLDHTFVEYILGLPDNIKRSSRTKGFLIDTFSDILPEEIYKRKKMGFVLPWEIWLRAELKDFAYSYLSDFAKRDFVNSKVVESIWQDFQTRKKNVNYARIWSIVALEQWFQNKSL